MSESKPFIHIRIRDLRREHSLTQEALAEALGISRQSINAMEAGRCLPSLPVAMQIASFFSVPLNMVFADTQAEPNQQDVQNNENNMLNHSSLTTRSPLQEMREAIDELIDETRHWPAQTVPSSPAVNVYQNKTEVIVEVLLPGYQKDQLTLEVGEDFLTISGENSNTNEETREFFRREYAFNSFKRTISLPAVVNPEQAAADMKQGILTVRLVKIVEDKPKVSKIQIKESD